MHLELPQVTGLPDGTAEIRISNVAVVLLLVMPCPSSVLQSMVFSGQDAKT